MIADGREGRLISNMLILVTIRMMSNTNMFYSTFFISIYRCMYKLYIGLKKHLIFLRNYPDTQFAQEETQ